MSDDVLIRPAEVEDVAVILKLITELAEYERLASEVEATEADLRASLFGPTPRAEAIVAEVGGDAVGFALWFHNYSTFLARPGLYLEDLFVRSQWRGRGVGGALLRHLARIAVERGCGRMEWSVLDWNEQAIGFYRSIGARGMDEWTVNRLAGDALHRLAKA
ncbi:MAG: GNAT family N-acetyltransferase [Acidobacteria bacterium]|nr:GNAT family N-acetyltransferase [Acidobacteriota bacterium]